MNRDLGGIGNGSSKLIWRLPSRGGSLEKVSTLVLYCPCGDGIDANEQTRSRAGSVLSPPHARLSSIHLPHLFYRLPAGVTRSFPFGTLRHCDPLRLGFHSSLTHTMTRYVDPFDQAFDNPSIINTIYNFWTKGGKADA